MSGWVAGIGAVVGAAGSYLSAKEQKKAAEKAGKGGNSLPFMHEEVSRFGGVTLERGDEMAKDAYGKSNFAGSTADTNYGKDNVNTFRENLDQLGTSEKYTYGNAIPETSRYGDQYRTSGLQYEQPVESAAAALGGGGGGKKGKKGKGGGGGGGGAGGGGGKAGGGGGGGANLNKPDAKYNQILSDVAAKGMTMGNSEADKAAKDYAIETMNATNFDGRNDIMSGLAGKYKDISPTEANDLVMKFLGEKYGAGGGGGGGGSSDSTPGPQNVFYVNKGYNGDPTRAPAPGSSSSGSTTESGGVIPDSMAADSFYNNETRKFFDPSQMDPANNPALAPYIEALSKASNKASTKRLMDLTASAEGKGRLGSGFHLASRGFAEGEAADALDNQIAAAYMGEYNNAMGRKMDALKGISQRDLAAMGDKTARWQTEQQAQAAKASARASAQAQNAALAQQMELATRGQELDAIKMLMGNNQFSLGQEAGIGQLLSQEQQGAFAGVPGLSAPELQGMQMSLGAGQAMGNVAADMYGSDAQLAGQRAAANAQRAAANAQLKAQMANTAMQRELGLAGYDNAYNIAAMNNTTDRMGYDNAYNISAMQDNTNRANLAGVLDLQWAQQGLDTRRYEEGLAPALNAMQMQNIGILGNLGGSNQGGGGGYAGPNPWAAAAVGALGGGLSGYSMGSQLQTNNRAASAAQAAAMAQQRGYGYA